MTSVLFVRLSAMGDLMHAVGPVQALHRARPDWRLTVVTQAENAPLLAGIPGIARVVEFDRRGGPMSMLRLRSSLRGDSYDVAIDLQGNWKSAFVAWISGARDRIGAGARWRREPASRLLLRRTIAVARDHPAVIASALVAELAGEVPMRAPELRVTTDEVDAERRALAAIGVDPSAPFRVIVITDPRDPRALRPPVVLDDTAGCKWPVVHLYGPAEAGLVAEHSTTLRHGAGEPRRLLALGAILAAARGDVLGPDQGATHVLAAAGAPCRIMFGAQDPVHTAPVSAVALVSPSPPACSPCNLRRCTHDDGPVCMQFAPADGREVPFGS